MLSQCWLNCQLKEINDRKRDYILYKSHMKIYLKIVMLELEICQPFTADLVRGLCKVLVLNINFYWWNSKVTNVFLFFNGVLGPHYLLHKSAIACDCYPFLFLFAEFWFSETWFDVCEPYLSFLSKLVITIYQCLIWIYWNFSRTPSTRPCLDVGS